MPEWDLPDNAYGDVAKTIELHSYTRDGGDADGAGSGITIGPGELAPLVPGGWHRPY